MIGFVHKVKFHVLRLGDTNENSFPMEQHGEIFSKSENDTIICAI